MKSFTPLLLLLLAHPRLLGATSSAGPADGGTCDEADNTVLMQRGMRSAGLRAGQGPFTGPGSAAYAAQHGSAGAPRVPAAEEEYNDNAEKEVEFYCQGRFYHFRFDGGYGNGSWCMEDHTPSGKFTLEGASTALKVDALNRYGLEIGPLDWYGFMEPDKQYKMAYDGINQLVFEEVGNCSSGDCNGNEWKDPDPTPGEIANGFQFPPYEEVPVHQAPRLTLNATWCNSSQVGKLPACNGSAVNGNVNVFGGGGLLRIHGSVGNLSLPLIVEIESMKKTLPLFGASLIPHGEVLPSATKLLTLLSYSFAPSFLDNWVYEPDSGPGMFLEHHLFAHYFTNPTRGKVATQDGAQHAVITLGRQVDPSEQCQGKPCEYWLTAFSVPSGYTIHAPPGCIHEDWTNRDVEVTTLADFNDPHIDANTVYLRNDNGYKPRLEFFNADAKPVMVVGSSTVNANVRRDEISDGKQGSVEYVLPME